MQYDFLSRRASRGLFMGACTLCLLALVAYPVVVLLHASFVDFDRSWNAIAVIPGLGRIFFNTFVLALGSVGIALALGTSLAIAVNDIPLRWKSLAVLIAIFPMLLPSMAGVTGWAFVFAPKIGYGNQLLRFVLGSTAGSGPLNIYTMSGITLVTAVYLTPYAFIFLYSAVRGIDPRLLDAAQVNGSSRLGSQLRVTFPLIRPAFAFAASVLFLLGLGQFTAPLLLGRAEGIDVITTSMFRFAAIFPVDRNAAALLALPILVAAMAFVVLNMRVQAQGTKYHTTASSLSLREHSTTWPFILVLGYGALAIVPPVMALVLVALSPYWSESIALHALTARNLADVWNNPVLFRSVRNTVEFSVLGTVLGIVLSLWLSFVIVRGRGFTKRLADLVVNLPLSVPGIVLGMGILLAYALGPFGLYGSRAVFVVAFAVIFLPLGVRIISSSLLQIGPQYEAAARTCGASRLRATLDVLLPLLRPGLAGGAMLLFVMMSHEFATSQLLATSGTQVMATQLWGLWENGSYPVVASLGLVMTAISFVGAMLLARVGAIDALGK